jgi:hypothetical protein
VARCLSLYVSYRTTLSRTPSCASASARYALPLRPSATHSNTPTSADNGRACAGISADVCLLLTRRRRRALATFLTCVPHVVTAAQGRFRRNHFLFVHWAGDKCPVVKRGKANALKEPVKKGLNAAEALEHFAQTAEDVAVEDVINKMTKVRIRRDLTRMCLSDHEDRSPTSLTCIARRLTRPRTSRVGWLVGRCSSSTATPRDRTPSTPRRPSRSRPSTRPSRRTTPPSYATPQSEAAPRHHSPLAVVPARHAHTLSC